MTRALTHIDFWIKSVFGDAIFATLIILAFATAILSNFW